MVWCLESKRKLSNSSKKFYAFVAETGKFYFSQIKVLFELKERFYKGGELQRFFV